MPPIQALEDKDASWPPAAGPTTDSPVAPAEPTPAAAPPAEALPAEPDSAATTAPAAPQPEGDAQESQAVTAVRDFYAAFNRGELDTIADRFSEDAVYHDAIYLEPFFGRDGIAAYFNKFKDNTMATELKFVISEITGSGDQCGVCW